MSIENDLVLPDFKQTGGIAFLKGSKSSDVQYWLKLIGKKECQRKRKVDKDLVVDVTERDVTIH